MLTAAAVAVLFMALSCDRHFERRSTHGGFVLVEDVQVDRRAFIVMAEAGRKGLLPIPTSHKVIRGQRLQVGGRTVWSSDSPHHVNANPAGDRVLLRPHRAGPSWLIVERGGARIPVPPPDSLWSDESWERHFQFWQWNDDQTVHAFTSGSHYLGRNRWMEYIRIWEIDVRTGAARVVGSCEQVPGPDIRWEETACGAVPVPR